MKRQWKLPDQLSIRDQDPSLGQIEAFLEKEDTELEGITKLSVFGGRDNVEVLTALKKRMHELKNVTSVNSYSLTKEAQQALIELLSDADVRRVHFLGGDRGTVFPDKLANFALWPKLCTLKLEKIVINEQAMKDLCDSLSQRERPVAFLSVDFQHCSKDSLSIFAHSITRIRPTHLSCFQIEQDDLCILCDQLNHCETVTSFSIDSSMASSHYRWSHRMIESLTRGLQQMPLLERFDFRTIDVSSEEQMVILGRLVSSRPSLGTVRIILLKPPRESLMTAFFEGCGFHPRLWNLSFGSNEQALIRILYENVRTSHSWRAKCLVVLLAGATIKRVGERSTVWQVSRDVFRRLVAFLDPPVVD